ncbi:hypothetical protein DPEC_G00317160 [Dallia pectoralis]|uniref:Uncharacterized protein n=1 Tax=Dallia pectoralis TaxID=75939 RepID=A0ACC2FCX3_DALPE|nr:hypothetical protein DPEC_G00317160 [Dallia pectoralis]
METAGDVIPIWQNKPHGSTRSVVRRIGSIVPIKPPTRACFQELPGLPPLRHMDGPVVPTLADIAWIAADDESETYARVRSDSRPLRHEWRPTPLLVMHRNSSVPNFRRDLKKVEGLRKPAVTAMNHTTSLQDELSRLRSQIAKIVATESGGGSQPLTPDLLSPDDTSMSFSLAPFETAPYQPAATASFVISDVTEEEEEDEDEEDVVSVVSELMPDPMPSVNMSASMSASMTASTTFDLDRPSMDFREAEEDTVSLSKSTSFADVMDILKDMNRMKMSKDRYNRGCTSLMVEPDSGLLISEALRKKFTLKEEDISGMKTPK